MVRYGIVPPEPPPEHRSPWWERNAVLAGTLVAAALLLVQPFIDTRWPGHILAFTSNPYVRLLLGAVGIAAAALILRRVRRRKNETGAEPRLYTVRPR